MNITNFEMLLAATKQQGEPQRMLFVFLKASLPKDHDKSEASSFESGEGGALTPIMCVDKAPEELTTFVDLVKESEQMEQPWDMVLIACIGGRNGTSPTADDAVAPLKMMAHTVESGGDLSKFLAFDKKGEPIQFG